MRHLLVGLFAAVAAAVLVPVANANVYPGVNPDSADIPTRYLNAYDNAAREYQMPWQVLAAIGKVETDHGRSDAAGRRCCAGPMMIHRGLFKRIGVDGDGDGRARIGGVEDSVYTAARYLNEVGAQRNLRRALYRYNYTPAFVRQVIAQARLYGLPADALNAPRRGH